MPEIPLAAKTLDRLASRADARARRGAGGTAEGIAREPRVPRTRPAAEAARAGKGAASERSRSRDRTRTAACGSDFARAEAPDRENQHRGDPRNRPCDICRRRRLGGEERV